jgi:hypothetical protein
LSKRIEFAADAQPTALCLAPKGRLLVADNGPSQQVLIFENVAESPRLAGTWGHLARRALEREPKTEGYPAIPHKAGWEAQLPPRQGSWSIDPNSLAVFFARHQSAKSRPDQEHRRMDF